MKTASPSALVDVLPALRSGFVAVMAFSLVASALLLVPSLYMLQVYDRVLASGSLYTLAVISAITLALYALLSVVEWVRGAVLVRLATGFERRVSDQVFLAAVEQAARGGAAQPATQDLATLRQFIGGPIPLHVVDAPLALVFLAAAFVVDTWLGVFVTASILILVGLAVVSQRLSQARLRGTAASSNEATRRLDAALRHVEAMRALGMVDALRRRWQGANGAALASQVEAGEIAARVGAVTKFVRLAAQSLVLGLGAVLVIEQRITPGMMIATSILLGRSLAPIEALIQSLRPLVAAGDAWRRLAALLDALSAEAEPIRLPAPAGRLTVERLVVAAPGAAAPAVRNVSFELAPGRVLGIVGPSASGKSTLARALVAAGPVAAGSVRLDGAELAHWPREQLAGALGYLPQDVALFDGTVAENIARLGTVDEAAVVAAAQQAGVHELILRLPQGYATPLGHGGLVLSHGQRQRIGLARALYGRPVVVVLDEPNASLDDQGERALQAAVQRCRAAGQSVVVISHRMAVLQAADELLVLRDGVVALWGPRELVMKQLRGPASRSTAGPAQGPAQGPAPQGAPESVLNEEGATA